jgi:hypothetical protein
VRPSDRRGDGVWLLIFVALLLGAKLPADAATPPHHHAHHRAKPLHGADPPLVLPGSAARLSPASIYATARRAGFTPSEARVATAIALAESGGHPRAHNPTPPDNSYGLWQINMLGSLGPGRRGRFGLHSNSDLYDPGTNARAAYEISGGGSTWRPWTTYTRGSYLRFLSPADQGRG